MPTRAEVIQGLRARDELQNRDIALLLDYLEQEASGSSGTRATILSSRRRVQDEVTPRDIEAIYDYLAELGTPANSFEVLRRLLRRRDIFGIQVANFIMDEIDAASFGPPATVATLQHYFDMSAGTVFSDEAGTIPSGNGDDVRHLLNLGDDGTPLINSDVNMSIPTLFTGGPGGQPYISHAIGAGSGPIAAQITAQAGAGGASIMAVCRSIATNTSNDGVVVWFGIPGQIAIWANRNGGNDQWQPAVSNIGSEDPGKTVIENEWVWAYATLDSGSSSAAFEVSGGTARQEVTDTYGRVAASATLNLAGEDDTELAMLAIWDGALSAAEAAAWVSFVTATWGTLPFTP